MWSRGLGELVRVEKVFFGEQGREEEEATGSRLVRDAGTTGMEPGPLVRSPPSRPPFQFHDPPRITYAVLAIITSLTSRGPLPAPI